MAAPLTVTVHEGSPTVVRLSGDLDVTTVPTLRDAVHRINGTDVIIDCADLQFLDSSGISLFVGIRNERDGTGHSISLRNVGGIPRRALEVTGLLAGFEATVAADAPAPAPAPDGASDT